MSVITLDEAKNYLKVDSADDNALIYDEVGESIEIPKSPLQEVSKIETIDDAGVKTEVDDATYNVDLTGQRGRVMLKAGCTWPTHRGFASFIITVKAGYGDTADKVPSALKQAALAALAVLYDGRGQVDEQKVFTAILGLCAPYRIIRL